MSLFPVLRPRLPQDDDDPRRAEQLREARDDYAFCYDYPDGVPFVERVPLRDVFTLPFLAEVVERHVSIASNHTAATAAWLGDDRRMEDLFAGIAEAMRTLEPSELISRFWVRTKEVAARIGPERPRDLQDYEWLFRILEAPSVVESFSDLARSDLAFAWQRIAGANPMTIRCVDRLPAHFPVTEEHFTRAAGPGDSLAAALAEGRAFLADYGILDGVTLGDKGGQQKYLYAPIGLFAQTGGAFRPIAIQCEPRPGVDNPVITPDQGWSWTIARYLLQAADGNIHQAVIHLADTHLVMEAIIVSVHRQLARCHPVHILLEPHFEMTLALNNFAKNNLIAPDGEVEYVLAGTLETSMALVKKARADLRLDARHPRREIATRGLGDTDALPVYPYRDDALPVWDAITRWVESYLRLYYRSDADVVADVEIQALGRELGASDGARIGGVPTLDSVSALTELLSLAIFTASAQHAAVNFPQYPYMGYLPNMAGASYAPRPTSLAEATPERYLAMLPPMDQSLRQHDIVYLLSSVRENALGQSSFLHFTDFRVHPLARAFEEDLERVERETLARDASRILPYPFLRPSLIPASIHI